MKILYTAEATSTGDGRNGSVRSSDGRIDLPLASPTEVGGSGQGSNPEQLFAAGYAACFHSALRLVARRAGADVEGSEVTGLVGFGRTDAGGYGLAVTLRVHVPAVDPATARELAEQAHQVCPYSNATRGNIEVTLEVG